MHIVTSSIRLRSGTARTSVLRAAPYFVLLAWLAAGCQDIDRDPPRFPDGGAAGSDAGGTRPDGGGASTSDAASDAAGDATADASASAMDGSNTDTQDGGADDARADGSTPAADAATDAAADAMIAVPSCADPAPSGSGCYACTQQGWVEGAHDESTCKFLGIPYAKPPVGALRFAPPQAADAWTGVRTADPFGAACVQGNAGSDLSGSATKSEDCLFVNVWMPDPAPSARLPVMVFIHGGAFIAGASNPFSGIGLLSKGPVIVVSLNYRLGALGFFAHPDLDATRAGAPSGSDGIRDQQLALRWVRDNIAAFQGDPNNVTVFGESAGAASVCAHIVSPGSRDLARRFILQSGVCTRGVGNPLQAIPRQTMYDLTRKMADALCPDADDEIACLRGLPAQTLMDWVSPDALPGSLSWLPVIEGAGGVLPDPPHALIERGEFNHGELIIGTNRNEYALFALATTIESTEQLRSTVEAQFGARTDDILALYASTAASNPKQAYIELMTDLAFRCPARSFARALSSAGSHVYLYSFDQGDAWHADELGFVFGPTRYALARVQPTQASADAVRGYWTSFALDGDPSGGSLPAWPAYQTAGDQHMTLLDAPAAASALQAAACDFWDAYVPSP